MKINSKHRFLLWFLFEQGSIFANALNNVHPNKDILRRYSLFGGCKIYEKPYWADRLFVSHLGPDFPLASNHYFDIWNDQIFPVMARAGFWKTYAKSLAVVYDDPDLFINLDISNSWNRHELQAVENLGTQDMRLAYIHLFMEVFCQVPALYEGLPFAMADFNGYFATRAHHSTTRNFKRVIGKFSNGMSDNAWPHYRERLRMASGLNQPLPKFFPAHPGHYAFVSKANEGNIACTPSHNHLVQDRQISMRPGRYLSRYYPYYSNEQVKQLITKFQSEIDINRYIIGQSVEDVVEIYNRGPDSCMDGQHDWSNLPEPPAAVYFSPDVSVAGLLHPRVKGRFSARCVVNLKNKTFGRLYGDSLLAELLKKDGYTDDMYALEGCRVRAIPAGHRSHSDIYVMPYVDYICRCTGPFSDRDGEWFKITDDGEFDCQSTSGHITLEETFWCDSCEEDRIGDQHATYRDGEVCDVCADERYRMALDGRRRMHLVHVDDDETVYSEHTGDYYVDSIAALDNGLIYVDSADDYIPADDTVEDLHGEIIMKDEAFPILDAFGDHQFIDSGEVIDVINRQWYVVAGFDVDNPEKVVFVKHDDVDPAFFVDGYYRPALSMILDAFMSAAEPKCFEEPRVRITYTPDSPHTSIFPFYGPTNFALDLNTPESIIKLHKLFNTDLTEQHSVPFLTHIQSLVRNGIYSKYLHKWWEELPHEERVKPSTLNHLPALHADPVLCQKVIYEFLQSERFQEAEHICAKAYADHIAANHEVA